MYLLYTLNDANTNEIRYVGLTKNPQVRFSSHKFKARNGRKLPVSEWIRSVDYQITFNVVQEFEKEYQGHEAERALIKAYREQGINLTNQCLGGPSHSGGRHTEATKKAIAEKNRINKTNYYKQEGTREKFAEVVKARWANFTPEQKKAIAEKIQQSRKKTMALMTPERKREIADKVLAAKGQQRRTK